MAADRPIDIQIRGVGELHRGMATLAAGIERGVAGEFKRTADQTASLVAARVPRRSGRLASSVRGETNVKGASVAMGAGVPYAGWIEYGGGHGRPYVASGRYLEPTAKAAAPAFQRAGETAARNQIRSMRWPTPTVL
jgi:bacteriophage HK97-gp10 putative tail-component